MKPGYTAIVNAAQEGGYWAICPEVPGANGQGETVEEAKRSLEQAVEMLGDYLESLPDRVTAENLNDEVDMGGSQGKEIW